MLLLNCSLHKQSGETNEMFIWRLGQAKENQDINYNWDELAKIFNKELYDNQVAYTSSCYRKQYKVAKNFFENCFQHNGQEDISEQLAELRKERAKLQTLNLERSRIERKQARHELFYEQIGSLCQRMPMQEMIDISDTSELQKNNNDLRDEEMSYVCVISDIHYGASFKSMNNEYSPEIAKERFNYLYIELVDFVKKHKITHLTIVNLGDTIQNILRLSDIKMNDSTVVQSIVEISRIIAELLAKLSRYCYIVYYHVNKSNHSQYRALGSKANELENEDLEYVIANYIKDLCSNNESVSIKFDEEIDYVWLDRFGFNIACAHGHKVKNNYTVLQELNNTSSIVTYDYVILGHDHHEEHIAVGEGTTYDKEVLRVPSFVGSDPYADSLLKGSKAAVNIFGFSEIYGHTETYKIILN